MIRTFFITGSSRGIGEALANFILENDADATVYGIARNQSIDHPRFRPITADLSDDEVLVNWSFPNVGQVDEVVLVNNAGTLGEIGMIGGLDAQQLSDTLKVNFSAPASLCNAFVRDFQSQKGRKVILNISTGAAFKPYEGWGSYCSSKAGMEMFSAVLRTELLQREDSETWKVLSIQPGVVDTQMQDIIRSTDEEHFPMVEKFHELKHAGKLFNPTDVACALHRIIENPDELESWQHRIEL